ncbi:hypothetical protein SAMN04488126_103120 [Bhargavaea beijingensis]|uniref:Uncharacterized protein n=1 Tax=Bhargavaea beijingensis TaxID=426756 RepID=A0A1G6ZYG4_9BACL|nr:hypothetical protein SAMN04488126_103120 [Bhargavaea beijingensis]
MGSVSSFTPTVSSFAANFSVNDETGRPNDETPGTNDETATGNHLPRHCNHSIPPLAKRVGFFHQSAVSVHFLCNKRPASLPAFHLHLNLYALPVRFRLAVDALGHRQVIIGGAYTLEEGDLLLGFPAGYLSGHQMHELSVKLIK